MSHIAMEQTQHTCPIEVLLTSPKVSVGSLAFVKGVFQVQANASEFELGDSLEEGDDAINEAQLEAGTNIEPMTARLLFRSANTCLQKRYLGICAVSGNCTGRKINDARLENLGIPRYKSEQINQEIK